MIRGKKDFPLVLDNEEQEKWGLTFKTDVFGRKKHTDFLQEILLLDLDTSNKVREIQDKANKKIIELVKENYGKASVITEETLKGAWGSEIE